MKQFKIIAMTAAFVVGISGVVTSKNFAFTKKQTLAYPSGFGYYFDVDDCYFVATCPGGDLICKGSVSSGPLVQLRNGVYSSGTCGVLLGQQ